MDRLTSDLSLRVVEYLSVKDSSAFAATAARYYYLVHQYRRLRGPELVAVTSHSPEISTRQKTRTELLEEGLTGIQSPPNLALAFATLRDSLSLELPRALPDETVILEAVAGSIQSAINGRIEHRSQVSLMLGTMSNATIRPFCFEDANLDDDIFDLFMEDLHVGDTEWKVFIVYSCGSGSNEAEPFVAKLQTSFPDAAIVGGICSQGSISMPVERLGKESLAEMTSFDLVHMNSCLGGPDDVGANGKSELVDHVHSLQQRKLYCVNAVRDAVFGVALGGDVPVHSVVSRGVRSLIHKGKPRPSTSFYFQESSIVRPGSEDYIFRGEGAPPYHQVRIIKDRDTGMKFTPPQLCASFGQPELVGVRRPGEDGFELLSPHPVSFNLDSFIFLAHTPGLEMSLKDANVDLFDLDGAMCMTDVEVKMELLKEQTKGKKILGAVMFSCGARGPRSGFLISEDMGDARRFARTFEDVPLLGFYAGGEIGPTALAGRESVFQTGKATLQGFTAVFALFIVPVVDLGDVELDDSPESVKAFVKGRL